MTDVDMDDVQDVTPPPPSARASPAASGTVANDKENSKPMAMTSSGTTGSSVASAARIGTTTAAATAVAKSKAELLTYHVPFVERYRPKTLDDVVGNEETVSRLRSIAIDGNMPNLILSGPPGTGKTTSVHALARQLLQDSYKDAVLELNASDSRGIDVVRSRIKSFAMSKVTLPPGRHKIIILDEADSMTSAAQQALRRTMELFSNTTRFCLACNNSTKIVEAIQSRAAMLRYSRLTNEQVLECLLRVCQGEGITYTPEGLEAILFTSEGDLRNALNSLQAASSLVSGGATDAPEGSSSNMITPDVVYKVCDTPHPKTCQEVVISCSRGDTKAAVHRLRELFARGYSASDVIGTLFKVTKNLESLPEPLKLEYLRDIGFAQLRVSDGVNSTLQMLGLVARMSQKCQ